MAMLGNVTSVIKLQKMVTSDLPTESLPSATFEEASRSTGEAHVARNGNQPLSKSQRTET